MEMISVSSSDIVAIGYEPSTATLRVKFISGDVYDYFNVPETVYKEFLQAPSHGKFLHAYIRFNYRYQRVG